MRYVTSIERLAKQEGKQEGVVETSRENLIDVLEARFGNVPESITKIINRINAPLVLKTLLRSATSIESLQGFQQLLNETQIEEG